MSHQPQPVRPLLGSIQFGPREEGADPAIRASKAFVPKPISLPTSVSPVGQRLVRIAIGPIWTYATLAEAVVLRAQLDEQISAMSEGFA